MFREAITAQEVGTGMKKSHHLTASLYFGIALSRSFEVRGEAEREEKLAARGLVFLSLFEKDARVDGLRGE